MKRALAIMAFFAVATAVSGPLDARLTFSADGGKTWSSDFPTVTVGAVVRVRAVYAVTDSWEKRDVICASIQTDMPFASQTQKLPNGGYMQRDREYWKPSHENGAYVWKLDTGGLSRGTHIFMLEIGYWRKDEKGKNVKYITDSQPFYIKVN